jgi:uncharacterized membrane protein
MWGYEGFYSGLGWWWLIPIAIIIMFTFCFFMMRRHMGCMICSPSSRISDGSSWTAGSRSAKEILDMRYAKGEIGKEEYEQKKKDIDAEPVNI